MRIEYQETSAVTICFIDYERAEFSTPQK